MTRPGDMGRRSCHRSEAVADAAGSSGLPGESGYYLSVNRNKRDIRLDIATPAGAEVLERLLTAATCSSRTSGPVRWPGWASTTTAWSA